ncbi:toxin glutamine deamidase domain-containing protein [Streptomyces sp. NPDC029004]|uniref:toxin glutamine deamidase domain-containing protein n=1 Tax=Streptomyces sp. NPDC029004 TaxID=3154490 RepID=UPI0033E9BDD7
MSSRTCCAGDRELGPSWGAWPRKGVGHYFNVINRDGKIIFLDFQSRKAKPAAPRYRDYYVMRTN